MMMHRFLAFLLASCLFGAVLGDSNFETDDPNYEIDSKNETLQPEPISVKNISERHFNDIQNSSSLVGHNIPVNGTYVSESVSEDPENILVLNESGTIKINESAVTSDLANLNELKNDSIVPLGSDLSNNNSLIISEISDPLTEKIPSGNRPNSDKEVSVDSENGDEVERKSNDNSSYGRGDDALGNQDDADTVSNDDNNGGSEMRGDTDPLMIEDEEETIEVVVPLTKTYPNATSGDAGVATSTSPDSAKIGVPVVTLSPSTISWLDAFMLQHRDSLWILFNTFFMVTWIIIGIFVLYRLFGLPWCSPHISRTHYLVIHLLIFTTAAFEFVKLVHFSYGSQQGLPLFLILLLTHTPTPCLASSIILMIHCIFSASRVPIFRKYLPPFQHVAILCTLLILFSFIGDIIVGVSYDSAFLLIHRVILIGFCLFCFATFIFNYRKVVNIAQLMRREFRGELKSLAIPVSGHDESHEAKVHLKEILILWSRIVLVSCFAGICMCVFSFCLSIFFTISYVPIWAFWFLHSSIFVSQIIVVLTLTLGAALTLVHTTPQNVIYKYFVPILRNQSSPNSSLIKHGNFHYQRVALSNGSSNVPRISVTPRPITIVETEDQDLVPNNNLITELSTPPPFKTNINLRRSATFNCAPPPEHTYYGMPLPHCSTPIYPVLSEHLLPQSNSQMNPEEMVSFLPNDSNSYKRSVPLSDSKHLSNEDCEIPYGYVSPSRRYYGYGRERFSSLRKIPYNSRRIRPEISSPINQSGMAGALQALEIPLLPCNNIPPAPQESLIHSSFTRKLEGANNCSSLSSGSPRVKPEPPEKPLRRTEPILVKSVLKDNVTLESTTGSTPVSPNDKVNSFPKQGSNLYKKEELRDNSIQNFSPKPYDSTYEKNITPMESPLKSVTKKEAVDLPLCNSDKTGRDFYAFSKVANPNFNSPVLSRNGSSSVSNYSSNNSPILSINGFTNKPESSSFVSSQSPLSNSVSPQTNRSPMQLPRGTAQLNQSSVKSPILIVNKSQENYSPTCKNSKNLLPQLNLLSQDPCTDPSSLDNQSFKSIEYEALKSASSSARQSNETLNGHTDIETDNGSSSTLKGSSSSIANIETNFDPSTLPSEKKKSLKRNNSAAGYIPSRTGDESKSSSEYPDPDDKQQWYGTWGGRKHKRKGGSTNQEPAAGGLQFGRQLKKLPGSKGSLSSLVGRLKPKRSKSLYQAGHSKTSDELSSVDNIDNDGLSLNIEVDIGPNVEEDDDMFLPRVTEELDLETEILKSSSMLANFYSLKRSDLKNRDKGVDQTEKEPELTNGFDLEVEESFNFLHDDQFVSNVAKT